MSHIHLLSSRHDRVEKWYFSLYRVFDASTRRTVIVIVFLAQKRKPLFLVSFFLLFFLFFVEQFFLTALLQSYSWTIRQNNHAHALSNVSANAYNTENTYVPILRATHIRNVYIHSCTIHSSVKKEKKKQYRKKKNIRTENLGLIIIVLLYLRLKKWMKSRVLLQEFLRCKY